MNSRCSDSLTCGFYTGTAFFISTAAGQNGLKIGDSSGSAYTYVQADTNPASYTKFLLDSQCNLIDTAGAFYVAIASTANYVYRTFTNPGSRPRLACYYPTDNIFTCTVAGTNPSQNRFFLLNAALLGVQTQEGTYAGRITLTAVPAP